MNSQKCITVVIPAYNAATHLAKTLAALQGQTLRDWCALIVDDGSEDRTATIAAQFCEADERFGLIRQTNAGVSAARNAGVTAAQTEYVAFLDADDVWHADYLSKMFDFMEADPSTSVGFAQVRIVDEQGQPTGAVSRPKRSELNLFDLMAGNPATTCSNMFVRACTFEHAGLFRTDLNHAEDQLWLISAYLSGCHIEGLHEVLLDYRTNGSGLSSDLESMRKGWEVLCEEVLARHGRDVLPVADRARALNERYLARRALRLYPRTGLASCYMMMSLRSDWTQLIKTPWPSVPILFACLADGLLGGSAIKTQLLKPGANS